MGGCLVIAAHSTDCLPLPLDFYAQRKPKDSSMAPEFGFARQGTFGKFKHVK